MNALRLSLLLAAVVASLASVLTPESDIPEPDLCQSAALGGVDTLSILSGDGASSAAISDFQVLPYVYGSQGGAMLPLRFELGGSAVPDCVAFNLSIERCADVDCQNVALGESATEALDLVTYKQGAERVTRAYFWQVPEYVFVEGSLARLTVSVGSVSRENLIWIDHMSAFADAGMSDAPDPDAGIADADIADLPDALPL